MSSPLTDFSCGVVPWRRAEDGTLEVLLVQHRAGHWAFPKGHPEAGESHLETALRELAEECGISAVRLQPEPVLKEQYSFAGRGGALIEKTVHYFLGEVLPEAGALVLQEEEVQDAAWLGAEAARECMSFDEGRRLLARAIEALS